MPEAATPLAAARVRAGLTQGAAARAAGTNQATWSRWEGGSTRPSRERRALIANLLHANEAELFPPAARRQTTPLARRLAELRQRAGLSARELSGRLGLARGSVSSWEAGPRPIPAARLPEIAAALGVPLSELVL